MKAALLIVIIGPLQDGELMAAVSDRAASEYLTSAVTEQLGAGSIRIAIDQPEELRSATKKPGKKNDSTLDEWDIEVLQKSVSAQLDVIKGLIESPVKLDSSHTNPLVAADFACQRLMPRNLREVFADETIVVRRAATTPDSEKREIDATYQGAKGLAKALKELVTELGVDGEIRVAIKLFRIVKSNRFFQTRIIFQLRRRGPADDVQLNGTWRADWAYPTAARSDKPRLRWLGVEQFDHVRILSEGGALFSDLKLAILTAEAFLDQEHIDDAARYVATTRRLHELHVENGNVPEKQRLKLSEEVANVHVNLARVLSKSGRTTEARETLDQALEINPADASAHDNLANTLVQEKQFEQAIHHYGRALELKPGVAKTHMNLGIAYSSTREIDVAIGHYKRAIELNPTWANPHVNLGIDLVKKGRIEEAMEHYRLALTLRPDYPEAHLNIANAYLSRREPEQALHHYRKALEIKPDFPNARLGIGRILAQAGNDEAAMSEFRQAVALDPLSPAGHFLLARTLRRRGKVESALPHFEKTVELTPGSAVAHNELGATYQLLGQDRKAIRHYRQVLRFDPRMINTAKRLSWLRSTSRDDAVRDCINALELAKIVCDAVEYRHPGAVATLAAAYAECGQFEEAVASMEKAITLAQEAGQENAVKEFERMLELYRAGQPSRQPEPMQ